MKRILAAGAAFVLLAAASWPQDAPVAVMVKVQGDVSVRAGGGDPAPAAVGARLSAGDQVIPSAGGQAVVVHRTGRTEVVTEALTIEAPAASESGDMFSKTMQVFAQAANSEARRTGNRQGMIRPLPGGPAPISPRNGILVRTTTPTLTWFSVEGATGYRVQVRTEGAPLVRFEAGADTVFTIPNESALERGKTYRWTVAPLQGRPVGEQTFAVLGEDDAGQLDAAFAAIREMGLDPKDDGRLFAAIAYTDVGLLYDAADALRALETDGGVSADVYMLKGEVLDALGRLDEARAAFDKADEMLR